MKFRFLTLFLSFVILLSGCKSTSVSTNKSSADNSDKQSTSSELNMSEEAKKQADRKDQTLWYLLDEKGNKAKKLFEKDPNVEAVKKLVELHAIVVDNRNYTSINPEDEYKFYTKGFITELKTSNYDKGLISMFEDNQIETKQEAIAWYESTFSKSYTSCKVAMDSEFQILKCAENYLNKNKLKLNTTYQQHKIIYLQKEDSVWKISRIDKSSVSEKSQMQD